MVSIMCFFSLTLSILFIDSLSISRSFSLRLRAIEHFLSVGSRGVCYNLLEDMILLDVRVASEMAE